MKLKKLIKSYGFWTGLAGACVVLVNALSRAFNFEIEDKTISDIIMSIAGVLVVFGLVSVPKELYDQSKQEMESKEKDASSEKDEQEDKEPK